MNHPAGWQESRTQPETMRDSPKTTIFDISKPLTVNALGHSNFPEGWFQKPRIFFDYELIFMLDGEVVYIEEEDHIQVHPGEVIFLSPNRINSSLILSKPARFLFLHFLPGGVPTSMSREEWHRSVQRTIEVRHPAETVFDLQGPVGLNRWMKPAGVWHRVVASLEAAIQDRQDLSPFGRISESLWASQILLLLSRSLLEESGIFPVTRRSSEKLLKKADSLIQERYADALNVEGLAALLNVTPQYLIRAFQAHYGETPLARIHKVRLARARELLAQTDLTIKEISDMIGMPNVNHFCRFFRKQTGVSASEWRAQR